MLSLISNDRTKKLTPLHKHLPINILNTNTNLSATISLRPIIAKGAFTVKSYKFYSYSPLAKHALPYLAIAYLPVPQQS